MDLTKTAQKIQTGQVTPQMLELIGKFTRRQLEEDEVFVFSVILCDNEIDRDGERFPRESLDKLAELFIGKTGVFDHNPKAENQSARIFDAVVVEDESRRNSLGENYVYLKAWAYMVRCDKNADLILEIDAGIKKEVSVGCAVDQVLCSVCGKDARAEGCSHKKGRTYDGMVCHHLLVSPTDAYEWSFVAVPAQKNAGVTKRYNKTGKGEEVTVQLEKWLAVPARQSVTLSAAEHEEMCRQFAGLKSLAAAGEQYLAGLRRQVVKLALMTQQGLEPEVMETVAGKMDARELKSFEKALAKIVAGGQRPIPQTAGPEAGPTDAAGSYGITEFKI